MKKTLHLLMLSFLIGGFLQAQNVRQSNAVSEEGTEVSNQPTQWSLPESDAMSIWTLPSTNSTSGNTRCPGNTFKYQRTEYLITAAEIAASGFPSGYEVNSIGFLVGTAGVGTLAGTFTVYLKNTADATYTLGTTWNVTGFTMASSTANWTVPIAAGSYEVPFSGGLPFVYTGGGVYVAWEFNSPTGTVGTTALVALCNTALAGGLQGARSNVALPTALGASSAFRPATIFGNTFYTDIAAITNVYTLSRVAVPYGAPTPIGVRVTNVSAAPATFDVTVTVKDPTNTFTRFTSTQTVTNMAANSASILNFTGWNPTIQEIVNITAATSAISGENWVVNNTSTVPCSVNGDTYSYNYTTTGSAGFGFTYPGTGIFCSKFSMNGQGKVTGANLVIYNFAASVGNTISAVVLNSAGAIVAQSAPYVIAAGDLGINKNFVFPTPAVFTDEVYYVGLAQSAGTVQWYPMGTFGETPQRLATFYTADYAGGNLNELTGTNLKYGIEAVVAPNFSLPTITTVAASSILDVSATLNGSVMANSNSVAVSFEYGTTTAYGTTVAATPATITGTTVTSVLKNLTGLLPLTTYHFRAVGTIGLFVFYGADLTFTTAASPPVVVTLTATGIGNADATLRGTVNANSASSAVTFEYGLTTAYGTSVNGTPATVTGSTPVSVTAAITGLSLNTTYHYRIIAVNSGGTSNGNDITFTTGCNIPVTAGTITGLTSLCQGTSAVAYTVPPVTNATTYIWVLPTGATVASGSGTNSITVNYSTSAVSGNITVSGSNACGDGTSSSLAVTVNPLPVPVITGPASVCEGTTGVAYQTLAGMTGYVWTISGGGTITSGAGTNAIAVTWSTVGSRSVSVSYTSSPAGCAAAAPTVYAVNVVPPPVPVISGPTSACLGFTTNVYSTQTGMTAYTWTVSAGGAITAGAGTSAITVTWNTTGAKTVNVNYTNVAGCSALAPSVLNVTVNQTPVPTITGASVLCAGSTGVIYTTEPGYADYSWNISYGGIITSGVNTNQITVDWATAGTRTITVNYTNALGCFAVNPASKTVTLNTAPVPVIFGEILSCEGVTGLIYSTQPDFTGYTWTISAGGTITSGAGTDAVTVKWNNAGTQSVSVAYTNSLGCQSITPTVLTVGVDPKPAAAGVVLGTTPVCAGSTQMMYTVAPITNALTYTWTLPAGATVASGANTRTIRVDFAANAASGVIKVSGNNDCGLGVSSPNFNLVVNPVPATPVITRHGDTLFSNANSGNQWYLDGVIITGATAKQHVAVYTGNYTVVVTLSGCSSATSNSILVLPVSITADKASQTFDIYPNPNNGEFNIKVENLKKEEYSIEIYNNLGSLVWKQENVSIDGTYSSHVNLKQMPAGIYMVTLRNSANTIVKKVIVMN